MIALVEMLQLIYAKKVDLKGVTGVDTSYLVGEWDLASLKAEVVEIGVD